MSFNPERRRVGGFTLLEMMTAAAIGMVTVLAATAMFTQLRQAMENSDRKLSTASDLQLGTTVMQRTLENAGYHFPAPRLVIAIHNNVPAGTLSNGFSASSLKVAARVPVPGNVVPYTTAQEGIVEDSDVIEILTGTDLGNMVTVNTASGTGAQRTLVFNAPTVSDVLQSTTGELGPVLLFRSSKTECLGVILFKYPGVQHKYDVGILDSLFEPDMAAPAACPGPQMEVYRLGHRTRFMVYQFAGETRPHLAMQREIAKPGLFSAAAGLLGPEVQPVALADGIEDLQVAGVLTRLNPSDPTLPPMADCGAANLLCICNDGVDDGTGVDCVLDQGPAGNSATLRGVRIQLTSRGQLELRQEPMAGDPLRGQLPPSMDRPAPAAPDKVTRMQFSLAVDAPNLNPSLVPAAGP